MPSFGLDYKSFPDAEPTGAPQNDFMHIQSSPNAFGGAIGQAEEKLGQGVEKATDIGYTYQGMMNETLATDAETQYRMSLGDLTGKYKSKEGLDAVNSKDEYVQSVANLRKQYIAQLPNYGAQRAFNLLALRHEGYAIQDAATYSASQLKAADTKSANSSSAIAIAELGKYEVASNPQRAQDAIHNVEFSTRRIMQNQGYGDAMHEDQDHNLTFDDSADGKKAKEVYTETLDKALSMAYENKYHVLADRNAAEAYKLYQAEEGKIPGEARKQLDAYFVPKVRDSEVRSVSTDVISNADRQYTAASSYKEQPISGVDAGYLSAIKGFEGYTPSAKWDYKQYSSGYGTKGAPGEVIDRAEADRRFNTEITKAAQFVDSVNPNLDPGTRAALTSLTYNSGQEWAKSGLGDKIRAGDIDGAKQNFIQYVNAGGVPNDGLIKRRNTEASWFGSKTAPPSMGQQQFLSQADYYRSNYSKILDDVRDKAAQLHPDDTHFIDLSVNNAERRMNDSIRQQELSYKADADLVHRAVSGGFNQNGKPPTTVEEMVGSNPDVKKAWENVQVNSPLVADAIERKVLTANSKESPHDIKTYGPKFYDLFKKVHAPSDDPERLSDETKLYDYVGSGLTTSGMEKLRGEIAGRRTPDGEAESEMKRQFYKTAHSQISGTVETWGIKDPKGEEKYLGFLTKATNDYESGKRNGLTPTQMLNPESQDYIGKSIGQFKRNAAQRMKDISEANAAEAAQPTDSGKSDLNTPEGLRNAVITGKISRDEGVKIAIQRRYIRPPEAPLPTVPLSK